MTERKWFIRLLRPIGIMIVSQNLSYLIHQLKIRVRPKLFLAFHSFLLENTYSIKNSKEHVASKDK